MAAQGMKVLYIGVFRNTERPAVELVNEKELSSYSRFTKGNVSEFLTFFSRTVAERTSPAQRLDVEEQDYTFHSYARTEGLCGVMITNQQYPPLVAHTLLSKVVDEFLTKHPISTWKVTAKENTFPLPILKEYITKYQNPEDADSIVKIQRELDETKIVLHKTIENVLQRGEAIDDLVGKSNDLSMSSQAFYKQAKKQNSCCIVM